MFRRAYSLSVAISVVLLVSGSPHANASVPTLDIEAATVETVPVGHGGDAADDPAIWVDADDPAASLVIVNDKQGALETYDLAGQRVQRLTDGVKFWGNVDTRAQVRIGDVTRDLVAVSHRGVQFYTVSPSNRRLTLITEGTSLSTTGEGLCLYQSVSTGSTYVVVITIAGRLRQYELQDADRDGLIEGRLVRDLQVGSEAEGCVADDDTGSLYVSQEDAALWRYAAEPGSSARVAVDRVVATGGMLAPDVEGLTIADLGGAGKFLIASAQRVSNATSSYFVAYRLDDRGLPIGHRAFRVAGGLVVDDCDRTDGITAYAGDLGPAFPDGVFVCQDNDNSAPGYSGNQNLKFVPMERLVPFS